jgi:YjbE family integral membrane protein
VVLRIIFTLVVQQFDLPWLKLVGGLILFWIAVKLLLGGEAEEGDVKSGATVWEALKFGAMADIIMGLDNVLAIAGAAGGDMQLIILGLAISIPLVVFGSTILMWLLNHLPILVWAGSALLGWVAAELVVTEPVLQVYVMNVAQSLGVTLKFVSRSAEAIGAALVVIVGWAIIRASRSREATKQPAE